MAERRDTVTRYHSAWILKSLCCLDLRDEGWRTVRCPGGRLDWGRRWQGRWAWASDPQRRSPGPYVAGTEEIWGPHCWLVSHTHIAQVNPGEKKRIIRIWHLHRACKLTCARGCIPSSLAATRSRCWGRHCCWDACQTRERSVSWWVWFIVRSSIIIAGTQRDFEHVAFSLTWQLFLKRVPVDYMDPLWCHTKQTDAVFSSNVLVVEATWQLHRFDMSSTCLSYVFLDSWSFKADLFKVRIEHVWKWLQHRAFTALPFKFGPELFCLFLLLWGPKCCPDADTGFKEKHQTAVGRSDRLVCINK